MHYSTRSVRGRSETDNTNFKVRPKDLLQEIIVDDVNPLSAPVRINGKWFLPATKGQSEQLDSLWEEAS